MQVGYRISVVSEIGHARMGVCVDQGWHCNHTVGMDDFFGSELRGHITYCDDAGTIYCNISFQNYTFTCHRKHGGLRDQCSHEVDSTMNNDVVSAEGEGKDHPQVVLSRELACKLLVHAVQGTISLTSSIIRSLFVHSERIPCTWSKYICFRHVVHADRNSQHGAEGYQVGSYMTIADCSMVCSPSCHDLIDILERTILSICSRHEPSGGPDWVCSLVDYVEYFIWNITSPSLGNLQYWTESFDH